MEMTPNAFKAWCEGNQGFSAPVRNRIVRIFEHTGSSIQIFRDMTDSQFVATYAKLTPDGKRGAGRLSKKFFHEAQAFIREQQGLAVKAEAKATEMARELEAAKADLERQRALVAEDPEFTVDQLSSLMTVMVQRELKAIRLSDISKFVSIFWKEEGRK